MTSIERDGAAAAATGPAKRRWAAAVWATVMSLFWPGLGHLFLGDVSGAKRYLGIFFGGVLAFIAYEAVVPPANAVSVAFDFLVQISLFAVVFIAAGSAFKAARQPQKPFAGRFVRYAVYAVVIVLFWSWKPLAEAAGLKAWRTFHIPAASMAPSLEVGDQFLVWRGAYDRATPEAGDVLVFRRAADGTTVWVKRVVGLPGDRIEMRDGRLLINGAVVPREEVETVQYRKAGVGAVPVIEYVETLPNGRRHRIYEASDKAVYDNTRAFVVPPGHYFMLGDNRDDSLDSRAALGFVPAASLVGPARFIFFSSEGSFYAFWTWPSLARSDRTFRRID